MDLESALLWFSYVSLVFWSCVLAWCVVSIVMKQKKEKEWQQRYVPTLNSDIREPDIHSWLTLTQIEELKEEKAARRATSKTKKMM